MCTCGVRVAWRTTREWVGAPTATGPPLPFEGLTVELKVPSLGTFQRSPRETRDSVRKVTEIAEDWYHARAQASRRCSRDTPLNTESFARKGRSCSPSCSRTLPCACACARVRWIQAVAGMGEAWASVTYRQSRRECPTRTLWSARRRFARRHSVVRICSECRVFTSECRVTDVTTCNGS